MDTFGEILVSTLIVIGATFALIGSYGMLRLPEVMTRLHAATKASTLGIGGILLASMCHFLIFQGTLSIHELLISLFLFLTAPITALFVARAYLHIRPEVGAQLPKPENGDWSTYETPSGNVRPRT
ncbi:MAG: Na+/H+ antiporter subunit G [Betaproteobacteria bacterium HGW-Betaproteobacteria-12]|nr:MAG: Na+/H+ antiporter subunit G [Betaproteobacteria bacterium HGW-Betaproteobacteria-12]